MKRVVLLFALAMLGFVASSHAQTDLPGSCSAFYPEVLAKKAVIGITDANAISKGSYGQTPKPASPKHWVVYSDRKDNVTYTKPDGKVKYTTLGLNEQVRIAKIQNGYALVYTEPMAGIDYPKISHEAVSKGWIPMSKLLLWHSCPADSFGIYQKALICANLDQASSDMLGRLYLNPENKSDFKQLSSDMKFYYVMKTVGKLSLLAHTHTLDGQSNLMLYGWVDQQSYVPWNQRSCLEPTWDKESVTYFAKNDVKIHFYADSNREKTLAVSGFSLKEEPAKYDKYLYRMSKDQLRYPILDNNTSKLYNISTFTRLNSEGTYDMSSANNEKAKAIEYSRKITQEKLNINIGLVIDGTSSMGDFYPAVIEAIKKSCSDIFNSQYKIKVGAVIYRDYADGDTHSANVFKLTSPNQKEFYTWLESGAGYGIKSAPADKTYEEALYLGINTALDQLGFKDDQSNILIVVGDCGNDRNDTKFEREDIVKKIVDKDVHLMGFQVRNSSANQAFALFTAQMSYLIKSSLQGKYAQLKLDTPVSVDIEKTIDGYELVNNHNSIIYMGSHSFPAANTTFDLDKLSTLITHSVSKCAASVQRQVDLLVHHATVGFANSNMAGDVPNIDKAFVRSQVGDANYEQLNKTNTLITFSGYADKEEQARQLFKPVIFISSDELTELLAKLDPVNDAAAMENPNNREAYVNAMKALAMKLTGNNVEAVNSMGHREIMRMIQGLNEATDALKGYTIEQIANPQSVDNKTYLGLLSDFRTKYRNLRKIKDTKDWKYAIEMNGIKYYWIPAEDMP